MLVKDVITFWKRHVPFGTYLIINCHGSENFQNDEWTLFPWLIPLTMEDCKFNPTSLIWLQGAEQ